MSFSFPCEVLEVFLGIHEPLDPPKEWASKFRDQADADYHATIANLDWNAGRTF